MTHRWRPLARASASAGDLFRIDSPAQVGLSIGLASWPAQAGIYRTSDRDDRLFGQYDAVRRATPFPTVDIFVSVEGLNNFATSAARAGAIVSRTVGDRAAMYVQPILVWQSNVFERDSGADDDTLLVATSARLRVTPGVYVFASWMPRAAGYRPGSSMKIFGMEKRLGGHSFQLNVSNSIGSTIGQIARGAGGNDDWYLGHHLQNIY